MASVRGADPCLAAGSDPECVTTNRDRDTTYAGTGLGWLPWPKRTIKRKNGQYWDREKKAQHQKKDTPIPKKEVRIAFAVCFLLLLLLFSLHLSFMTLKALKLKKKTKTKKNQSPDPAILGRVRTRDPETDHFGPDFDSGSGYGSAFTDPQSKLALTARIGGTGFAFFKRTLYI